MPEPISHAEMIAAVRDAIEGAEMEAQGYRNSASISDDDDDERLLREAEEYQRHADTLRAVMAHLERTPPTDTQADLTERARAAIAKAISPQRWAHLNAGEESSVLAEAERLLAAALQSEREATAAETRRAAIAKTVAEQIGAEIVSIMETHDQQEAEHGYVDTPGGLEHLGDVWRLLGRWRDRLASPPAPQEDKR